MMCKSKGNKIWFLPGGLVHVSKDGKSHMLSGKQADKFIKDYNDLRRDRNGKLLKVGMSERKIIAGIDPGVKTGLAIWDCVEQEFSSIQTVSIIEAMSILRKWDWMTDDLSQIWFEDARLRTWFPEVKDTPEDIKKLQGVGSVKRDCSIWQEFCEYHKIPYQAIKPAKGQTKWDSEYFKRVTGWKGRTSKDARDAAILVFGAK